MTTTQHHLDQLAGRIAQAYHRKHPLWVEIGLTPGVWNSAAIRLNEVAIYHPGLPIDPELFVAVQDYRTFRRDPWCELTQEGSAKVYRATVRKIIKRLRTELATELRRSKRHLAAGRTLDDIMTSTKSRVSPIAKLVLCHDQDRTDLVEAIRPSAEAQHVACPLYRFACKNLMPRSVYPEPQPDLISSPSITDQARSFAWN